MTLKNRKVPVRVLLAALVVMTMAGSARATYVLDPPGATTTLSNTVTGASSVYEFATYSTAGTNRQLRQFIYTFPSGTDLSGATLTSHPGSVSYSGTTLTVTFSPRIRQGTGAFSIVISGVVNGAAGTYAGHTALFVTTNPGGGQQQVAILAVGTYTIRPEAYVSLTITTPHAGQSVLFGDVEAGVTSPPQQVLIAVDSSDPYLISRTIGGDAESMGLTVRGLPGGTQPAGPGSFTETFTVTPPWTTKPEVELSATVGYTVVQQ